MDIDQVQRRDINDLETNTISLAVDTLSHVNESVIDLLTVNYVTNNWYVDNGLVKESVTSIDKLVFNINAQPSWQYKNIIGIKLFGEIYSDKPLFIDSIGFNQYVKSVDYPIYLSTNVDVDFDITDISQDDLNNLITSKGFDIVVNINGDKSNAYVNISELKLMFIFEDKLANEKEAILNRLNLLDLIYPIGSIYMSVNDINPSLMFGGTWEKIEDKFLLGSGNYELGDTGGEATHTLTVDEMPSHKHTQEAHRHSLNRNFSDGSGGSTSAYITTANRKTSTKYTNYQTPTISNTGGGLAHNNMPPYLVVNIWQRTK